MNRLLVMFAGLYGALGVGLAAAASHGAGAANLGTASNMLLFHAPALLALGLHFRTARGGGRVLGLGALALLLGCGLFAGDLALRHFQGHALFPMAAPAGGTLMILGWSLVVVAGALLARD